MSRPTFWQGVAFRPQYATFPHRGFRRRISSRRRIFEPNIRWKTLAAGDYPPLRVVAAHVSIEVSGWVGKGTERDQVPACGEPYHLLELVGNSHGELVPLIGVAVLTSLTQKEFVDFLT